MKIILVPKHLNFLMGCNVDDLNITIGKVAVHIETAFDGTVKVDLYPENYEGGDPIDSATASQHEAGFRRWRNANENS